MTTTIDSTSMTIAPELFCVVEGLEGVDEEDPALAPVFVPITLIVAVADIAALEAEVAATVELTVVFGVVTRNQSAATGAPKPVSATNFVRLKPTRLNTEVVKLLKKRI
jgi:hypothetical protein